MESGTGLPLWLTLGMQTRHGGICGASPHSELVVLAYTKPSWS